MSKPVKIVTVPDFAIGERVGLGPDHNNPGHISEIDGVRAKVRFGHHPKEYRNWYGLDELVALPTVKIGDRVGFISVNDPNPGTVVELIHSRAVVAWDKPLHNGNSTSTMRSEKLVVLPAKTALDTLFESILGSALDGIFSTGGSIGFSSAGFTVTTEPDSVTHIVALLRDGQPRPNTEPTVHLSYAAAAEEANRLANKYPGKDFAVFAQVGVARTEIVASQVA